MQYLKILILLLLFCNVPSYTMVNVNPVVSSMLSYGTFLAMITYFWLSDKQMPIIHFILFGVLFSFISLAAGAHFSETFLVTFIKYFLFIITASTVLKDVKPVEIYIILLIGSLSIIFEAIFITGIGGRYSGFYLNPNLAGFTCILGYALGLTIDVKKVKIPGQILLSIAGLVTFSRTFLLIWILINLMSVLVSYKNIFKIVVCLILFVLFLSFGDRLDLNTKRLEGFSSILSGKVDHNLKEDSRTETWSLYYEKVVDNPVWGNGYRSFSGETGGSDATGRFVIKMGVHNTFLMIVGEAGIFLLIYFLWIYGYIFVNGFRYFKVNPSIFFLSFSLIAFMLTSHNYFDNYLVLFTSLWLFHEAEKLKNTAMDGKEIFGKSFMNSSDYRYTTLQKNIYSN